MAYVLEYYLIYKMKQNRIFSFPPIVSKNATGLILGSMPGNLSLRKNEYYAHPQNSFWKIIFSLFNEQFSPEYKNKISLIKQNNLAVWDVLEFCERSSSLDSDIKLHNAKTNDVAGLLNKQTKITKIYFNGQKAHQIFLKNIYRTSPDFFSNYELIVLPSTSPAHAKMSFDQKLQAWKSQLIL